MKKIITIFTLLFLLNSFNVFSKEKSSSAKTGKYISKDYANKNKPTTYTSKTKKSKK